LGCLLDDFGNEKQRNTNGPFLCVWRQAFIRRDGSGSGCLHLFLLLQQHVPALPPPHRRARRRAAAAALANVNLDPNINNPKIR